MLVSSDTPAPVDQATFTGLVHDALAKLYDTLALQQHALATLLAEPQARETGASTRGQDLRRLLLASIHALRPAAGVPASSPDWRVYRLLELRYIEGLEPSEAMRQLGLARSQFFREQARGIEALTTALWERYLDLCRAAPEQASERGTENPQATVSRPDLIRAEAERLSAHAVRVGVDDDELLADLAAIVAPLARAREVEARLVSLRALRGLLADRVVLRQALLVAVNALLNLPGVRKLELDNLPDGVPGVRVRAWPAPPQGMPDEDMRLCRSLAETINGSVEAVHGMVRDGDALEVRLAWSSGAPRTLLVVDDNASLADLFRRYLAGRPWRVLSARNGLEAREALADARPDVILLDVMMPREDGWEFLLTVKGSKMLGRQALPDVPIIVCSVLDQPQIALALGAAAYLPKPVTQQALLNALAPWG
jgi:CheY-like chemotaxis protein